MAWTARLNFRLWSSNSEASWRLWTSRFYKLHKLKEPNWPYWGIQQRIKKTISKKKLGSQKPRKHCILGRLNTFHIRFAILSLQNCSIEIIQWKLIKVMEVAVRWTLTVISDLESAILSVGIIEFILKFTS